MDEEVGELNDRIDQLTGEVKELEVEVSDAKAELETVIAERKDLKDFLDNIVFEIQNKLKE